MSSTRREEKYREAFEALEDLWTKKTLPLDTRRYICGLVQAAGRKQGDEVFEEALMEKAARAEPLHPTEQEQMFDEVDQFVFKRKRLRDQYILVILHLTVKHLNDNHAEMAQRLEERIRHAAEMN
jgi:hypothetical protein